MAGREIFNGRNSILQVLESLKTKGQDHIVQGYHGLVLENIRADEGTETAVEVTAGKRCGGILSGFLLGVLIN